jgi:hypothetical protein
MNEFWKTFLDKVKNTFSTTATTAPDIQTTTATNENLKIKLGFWQWVIGFVGVTLISILINFIFNDRAAGMQEMNAYEKYTTDIMVLNENPAKKRMLAQFFAKATPSPILRCAWNSYYEEVDRDYDKYLSEKKEKYYKLDSLMKKDSVKWTHFDMYKIKELRNDLRNNEIAEKATIVTPELKLIAFDYEKLGFQNLIDKDFENAKLNFENAYKLYPILHNLDEINKLLSKGNPQNDNDWITIYTKILNDYSWGMSYEFQDKMKQLIQKK